MSCLHGRFKGLSIQFMCIYDLCIYMDFTGMCHQIELGGCVLDKSKMQKKIDVNIWEDLKDE